MAPKRSSSSMLEDPPSPTASSSDDEELEEEEIQPQQHRGGVDDDEDDDDDEDEEDDEEADDDHELPSSGKKPITVKSDPAPKSTTTALPSSSDDDDDEESSESDDPEPVLEKPKSGSNPNPSTVKPASTKPTTTTTDPPKPKKTVSKPSISAKQQQRPAESEKDAKRKSKKAGGDDEEEEEGLRPEESEKKSGDGVPKALFQRLWSDEDEIVILKGMIESIKKGIDPIGDQIEFLESIKKSLQVDNVNCGQLVNKIRRLKKKYLNNFKRAKGGSDPAFSKPHEVKSYELMKEIWGGGAEARNGKDESTVSNGKKSKSSKAVDASPHKRKKLALSEISPKEMPKLEEERKWGLYPCLNESVQAKDSLAGGSLMKEGLGMIGQSKAKELEERWRKLYAAELKIYLERVELVREQTVAVLDALESSD